MNANLPNLELLEYKAIQVFFNDKENVEKYIKIQNDRGFKIKNPKWVSLQCTVFMQTWGSTCTGFDICSDGSPAIGGAAMTDAYTTVFYEPLTNIYIVFINNKLCYKVDNANEVFLEDLKNHNLKSLGLAQKFY